jgi:hypothetical protein
MSSTTDLQFTVLAAEQVYTNELTPVTAVPWPDRYTNTTLPYATVNFSEENMIWDFGDGTTYTGVSAVHIYNWPGEYTIKLTIIDEFGETVISTYEETIIVKDFILTQLGFRDLLDVIDIPSGRLVSPITVDFTLSWQNYAQKPRTAPQCTDGKQHLMNKGTEPGYWMCGESHPGHETAQQPEVTEFPIYTFNLFASGAEAQPLDIIKYNNNKYSHLELDWSFHSATPSLSAQPVTEILATRTDFVTGSSGDVNTYDLLYYKPVDNNKYIQTSASDPQGVFVGLSGNVSFYYRDDVTKCVNSRNEPVLITVELDQKKIFDQLSVDKRNLSMYKYTNTKPLIINNIKPRVNEAIQLGVTSIGLSEFEISKNKWDSSIINFTITIQDAFNFNILDSKTLSGDSPLSGSDVQLELLDSTTMKPITSRNYVFEQITSELGHLRGQLKFKGNINDVLIKATTTYDQVSGYKTDAIAPWLNSYRPEFVGTGTISNPEIPEQGGLYRYYYTDVIQYNGDQLTNNFTNILTGAYLDVDTNGVISDVIIVNPGENLTQPPRITVEDVTGDGAELVPRFNIDGGIVSDVIVIQGGRGYSLTPTLFFTLGDANATVPNATAVVDYNHRVELIAVQPPEPGIIQPKTWGLEYGESGNDEKPPRIVEATTRQGLTRSRALSAMTTFPGTPRDIKLDNNGSIYIATENKIVQIDPNDLELTNIYDDNGGGVGNFNYVPNPSKNLILEVDLVNVYIANETLITKINKVNNSEVGNTQNQITYDIQHILLHYNDKLYCLTNEPGLVVVDKTTMIVQDSITLPSGSYSDLTTTVDGKLYTVKDARYLLCVDVTDLYVREVYDFGPTTSIQTICGDSRGTIWLPDNTSRKLWAIDVVNVQTYNVNSIPGVYEYGSLNYSVYPTPGDGITTDHVLRAKGDWTGFHWLQKFGIIRPGDRTLIGYSSVFNINNKSGTYNISKINENHDQSATIKSYATQPWMSDQHNLWDEAVKSIVGDGDSEPTGLGKQVYERIANFTNNNTDIDECTIDNIHNHALLYDVDLQYYNLNYPPTLKRLLDLCSIKHSRLFGTVDYATENYDMYTDYTIPDTRENLGREMDIHTATITPGQKIVAYERFSKIYTPITVTKPTSGNLDQYNNLVDVSTDNNLYKEGEPFPLSAYNVFWQWDLVAPVTVKGVNITDYYAFYTFNESTELNFVEGVIDWDNPKTFLTPTLSSFDTWQQDKGILDNILEHQLRVGLDLFNETVTGDIDDDGLNNYYETTTGSTVSAN